MKKIFVSLVLAFGIAAASDVLNFATSKNVGPLNPHLYSPNEMFAQDMVYEGFVDYSNNHEIVPSLATEWSIENDGKSYVFKLREGVVFSNGEKFDANAVKANFDALQANKGRHKWLELNNLIENYEVVNDFTFKLNLSSAYEPTLRELAIIRPFKFIAPSAMIDKNTKEGIKEAIGTGPWMLVETKEGVSDTFKRNEKYWGDKPKLAKIVAKIIPDPNSKVLALRSGEVDYVYGLGQIPLDAFKSFEKEGYSTIISKPLITLAITINSGRDILKDTRVRKALSMAINKDDIVEHIFLGTQPRADYLYASDVRFSKVDLAPYSFNREKAAALLKEAGWKMEKDKLTKDGKSFEVELSFLGSDAIQKAIGEVYQAELKKLGITLNLKAEENTIFYSKQKEGKFDLIYNETWGAPYDPESFLSSMRLPAHADFAAQKGLKNKAQIDEKIAKALSPITNEEKIAIVKEVLNELHDEAVYIPVVYPTNKGVGISKLKGLNSSIIKQRIPFSSLYFEK